MIKPNEVRPRGEPPYSYTAVVHHALERLVDNAISLADINDKWPAVVRRFNPKVQYCREAIAEVAHRYIVAGWKVNVTERIVVVDDERDTLVLFEIDRP